MNAVFIPTGNAGKLREFMHAFSLQNRGCVGLSQVGNYLGSDFDWHTPAEDRQTFAGNGYRKLTAALPLLSKLKSFGVTSVLVDDSGLCLPRLNYSPGVHSATLSGEPRDDARNRKFLIDILKNDLRLTDDQKEPAFFVCSLLTGTAVDASVLKGERILSGQQECLDYLETLEPQIFARTERRLGEICSAAYGSRVYCSDSDLTYRIDLVMGFCSGFAAPLEQELLQGEGHGYDSMFFPKARPELSFASIPLDEKNRMSHRSEALRALTAWEKFRTAPDEIQELF
ncbi:MAG: non-canonical purine NTP pyrophosphatase [Proteobacteria bacterium]|nr:non-canonical purine NTP pyrophosphatase [Pseudomonadota bacterium]